MIKKIHTFGSSFTEGGGFEYWKYEEVKYIYHPYVDNFTTENTAFPFSWPGQLKNLIDAQLPYKTKSNYIKNYGRCGWGNERTYRKIFEIVNKDGFKKEEHLFLIEFSDECRAEFWSVEKQKHFLVNYDYGDEDGRVGLLYKQNVEPVFDYHRNADDGSEGQGHLQDEYLQRIAPMMTEYIRETFDRGDVIRRVVQNQVTFIGWMELMGLNWLCPLPNAVTKHPSHYELFKGKCINDEYESGYQYSIQEKGYGFKKETGGVWTDWHGGLAWSKMVARRIFNLMIEKGYLPKHTKLDNSESEITKEKLKIRNEIAARLPEIRKLYDELEGFRRRGGLSKEDYFKNMI